MSLILQTLLKEVEFRRNSATKDRPLAISCFSCNAEVPLRVLLGLYKLLNRLAVGQPIRGTDRNRTLIDQADSSTDEMLLPSLDDDITLLDVEGSRGVQILQSLVLEHLLLHDCPAFWVDANGHATTTLAQIAPSQRLLDRIHVARGFTAYQHFGAVCNLSTAVNRIIRNSTTNDSRRPRQPQNQDGSQHTPSLIVAPAVDAQYRADDSLGERHAATLQARILARTLRRSRQRSRRTSKSDSNTKPTTTGLRSSRSGKATLAR